MLELKNLSLFIPSGDEGKIHTVITDLCHSFPQGSITKIGGKNGSGKSTLLAALGNVIPEHIKVSRQGSILYNGVDLGQTRVSDIFHTISFQWDGPFFFFPTLESELAFPLENQGKSTRQISDKLEELLEMFELGKLRSRNPASLSGGEQKLILLALAAAIDAPVLLLDEPSCGLSQGKLSLICSWLLKLRQEGKIILLADHNAAISKLAGTEIRLGGDGSWEVISSGSEPCTG
ncbi:MAG: ATP-binding cassette domain-containing protein [Candidatus Cloacimonetes bacterium]|nr:ATP-binding cassette domain-containing protein [Candidatus Cloacimonadota bacterium]